MFEKKVKETKDVTKKRVRKPRKRRESLGSF